MATQLQRAQQGEERQRGHANRWRKIARSLQQIDQQKSQFLAKLSHELRNPMAPLSHALQMLLDRPDQEQQVVHTCTMMQRQIDHLRNLVDELLDIERIARGKIELRLQTVDLQEVIRRALDLSAPNLTERGHRLLVQVPESAVRIQADAARLTQVLVNLLNNAAKYTPPGGQISVRAHFLTQRAVISIEDNGVGIPATDLPHVFDLYRQVDRHLHMSQGGLGIGLALAKQLTEVHGGLITARSAGPGLGSIFTLELPIDGYAAAFEAPAHGEQATAHGRVMTGWRILVVDDNTDGADTLSAALQYSGHQTWVAYSGASALDLARCHHPHAALVDLSMPTMDGFELAQRFREDGLGTVLVAMTGWGSASDRQRCQAAGFAAHLVKPADLATIETTLDALLSKDSKHPQQGQRSPLAS